MRRLVLALLLAAGCTSPDPLETTARLRGALHPPAGALPGDGYVFLYASPDGPLPNGSGRPVSLSAVPVERGFEGSPPDADYLFAALNPGPYRVRGVIDARKTFDPDIDVLSQPFADDADIGLDDVALHAGDDARVDLVGGVITEWDPPMFVIDSPASGVVTLTSNTTSFTLMHITATALPFARPEAVTFLYQAPVNVDAGLPTSLGNLNLGQLGGFPQVVLQRIPSPDDGPEFLAADGGALSIIIPAVIAQPDPAGRDEQIDGFRAVNGLYLVVPPTALVNEGVDASGTSRTRRLPALPVGEYALTVIQATGQYWQVPNGLAPGGLFASLHGGPYSTQIARVNVVPAP